MRVHEFLNKGQHCLSRRSMLDTIDEYYSKGMISAPVAATLYVAATGAISYHFIFISSQNNILMLLLIHINLAFQCTHALSSSNTESFKSIFQQVTLDVTRQKPQDVTSFPFYFFYFRSHLMLSEDAVEDGACLTSFPFYFNQSLCLV